MPVADQALAFWTVAPGRGELRAEPLPQTPAGCVRVRTLYSGISRGTEALVFNGRVPASEWQRMRAPFQAGDFPAPVKYGYMSVGEVVEGPAEYRGRRVFCLYPHQSEYVVPADAVAPLPDRLPPARAVLGANMETALNAVWDATPRPGERISIIGAGVVGCLAASLCARIPGCDVELVDVNPARAAMAEALGARFRHSDDAGDDRDRVLHASGTPAGLRRALDLAGDEAEIIELSWYGDQSVELPLGARFHSGRLTLRASQVGGLPPAMRPRWTFRRRLDTALRLLTDPRYDVLITGESTFETLPETLARLALRPGDTLCHRIRYPHQEGSDV
jgi:threonine dehydrogenase-like Zn-dependent dehydrogenase